MAGSIGSAGLPVVDVAPLVGGASAAARVAVAERIQAACRQRGFFYLTGHGTKIKQALGVSVATTTQTPNAPNG
jgi:isopenicillin N synthase-like dioxygenase